MEPNPEQSRITRWFAPVAATVIYLWLLFIGGAIWWREYRAGDEFGQWMAAVIVVAVISMAGGVICKVDKHRAPAPFVDRHAQALVIPQSSWTGMSRIAVSAPWGVYLAAATWQVPALGIITLPAIAYLLGPALLRFIRRWRPGELRLDAAGVTYRSPGSERSLAWSQIAAVERSVRYSWLPDYWGFGRHKVWGIAFRATEGSTIFVRPETLAVPEHELERFCATLVRCPKARNRLGSPKALDE